MFWTARSPICQVVRVIASGRPGLPEEADLLEALVVEPVGADDAFAGNVAIRDGETVVAREAVSAGPSDAGNTRCIDVFLEQHRVVGDHRPEHDDASLFDEPVVTRDDLAIVLTRQAPRVRSDDLHG